jgi:sRNA-binding protein
MARKTTTPPRPTVIVRKKRAVAAVGTNPRSPTPPQVQKDTLKSASPQVKNALVQPPSVQAMPAPAPSATPPPSDQPPAAPPLTEQPPAHDSHQPNKRQREAQIRWDLLALFRQRWPQVFPADMRQCKPLAVGIHQEIVTALPAVKPWRIGQTIAFFQRGGEGAYWRAVLKGGPRYTLDGTPNGEVSDKDREHARQQLAALQAWPQAKRQEWQQTKAAPQGGGNRTSTPQAHGSPSGCTLRPRPS